jgi:hypothetical protein
VQGADEFIAINFTKDGKIGVTVWACALHDPIANLNFFFSDAAAVWVGLAESFRLGASHSLFRE